MSKMVQTVTGPISTEQLGSTLMHEHIYSSSMGIATHYPQFYKKDIDEFVCSELNDLKKEGYSTVVDATPVGLGRDVRALKRVSEATGMQIIATAGWWGMEPPYLGLSTEEQWAQCFIDDITKGCDGTDIKAGFLKASMDDVPTEWTKKIHHAVGIASQETGANIFLHTYCPKETPRHQLALLKEVGTDMNKVVVDHLPETTDLDFIKWIYDQGAWLGIDRFPIILFPGEYAVPTESRFKFIKAILDAGLGDRVLISHDYALTSTLFDNQPEDVKAYIAEEIPYRLLFFKKYAIPKFAEMGVDPEYLWRLTYENPKKFFEG